MSDQAMCFHESGEPPPLCLVRAIAKRELSSAEVCEMRSAGIDNHLFLAHVAENHVAENHVAENPVAENRYVLRMSSAVGALQGYRREREYAALAQQHGIATIVIRLCGEYENWAYCCYEYIEPYAGTGSRGSESYWGQLGRWLRVLGTIQCSRITLSHELKDGSKRGSESSSSVSTPERYDLAEPLSEYDSGRRSGTQSVAESVVESLLAWIELQQGYVSELALLRPGILPFSIPRESVQRALSEIAELPAVCSVCHGDLSISNTLRSRSGEFVLLDWGNARSHLHPYFDIAEIDLWAQSSAWHAPFAEGYGIPCSELKDLIEASAGLQLWRALWSLSRDIARAPEVWEQSPYAHAALQQLERLLRRYR